MSSKVINNSVCGWSSREPGNKASCIQSSPGDVGQLEGGDVSLELLDLCSQYGTPEQLHGAIAPVL